MTLTLWTFLLLLLFLPSSATLAKTSKAVKACSTRDYSKQMGPVRNQGNYNFCSSFTAADLVGQKLGYGSRISALQTSISGFSAVAEGSKYQRMNTKIARETIQSSYGTTGIPNAVAHARDQVHKPELEKYQGLMTGMAVFAFNLNSNICLDLYKEENERSVSQHILRLENNIIQKLRPNIPCNRDTRDRLEASIKNTVSPELFLRLMKMEMEQECGKSGKTMSLNKPLQPKIVNCQKDKKYCVKHVNEALDKGRISGITYFPARIRAKSNDKHAYHASSVVARKWDKERKTCQYKIRNSWGPDCSPYKNEPGVRCDKGNIWVDESILAEMTNQATYIK